MFFIQGAHGALEGFLAHTEALLNILGGRTVGKGQSAAGLLQFVQQLIGKIAEASFANALQREVELAVGAHIYQVADSTSPAWGSASNIWLS